VGGFLMIFDGGFDDYDCGERTQMSHIKKSMSSL